MVAAAVAGAQLAHNLARVQTRVLADDRRDHPQRLGETLHGERALTRGLRRELLDSLGHDHLGAPASVHDPAVLHGGHEHAERVVEGPLRLAEHVRRRAAEHDGARLALRDAAEFDELVLANHDLLDQVAGAEDVALGVVKGGADLTAGDQREALDAVEIGVLDGRDALVAEHLLGVVVDELAVDEEVAAVRGDLLALGSHLRLLRSLDLANLRHGVHPHARAVDLDLVGVHRRVRD